MFATQITGKKAQDLVKKGALLIDLRDPVSFRDKSIPGAVNLSLRQVSSVQKHPKATKIVLIGDPADKGTVTSAGNYLSQYGFQHVYVLPSIDLWAQ